MQQKSEAAALGLDVATSISASKLEATADADPFVRSFGNASLYFQPSSPLLSSLHGRFSNFRGRERGCCNSNTAHEITSCTWEYCCLVSTKIS